MRVFGRDLKNPEDQHATCLAEGAVIHFAEQEKDPQAIELLQAGIPDNGYTWIWKVALEVSRELWPAERVSDA
jgi:hypothetical protein